MGNNSDENLLTLLYKLHVLKCEKGRGWYYNLFQHYTFTMTLFNTTVS